MRVVRLLLVALLLLVGILVTRALTFTLEQGPLPPATEVDVDVDAASERLSAALRIPTVTRGQAPQFEPEAFDALRLHLEKSFPRTFTTLSTRTISRHTLLLRWKGRDHALAPVLLMAHQDVVPVDPETESKWEHPPFGGAIAEGYIWGRGALDVKSGVLGILEATETLLQAGFQPERDVYLLFGHDEEIGGESGAKRVAELFESEGVRLAWVLDEGGAIVSGVIPGVDTPVALVGVAEKGYVSLRLTATGSGGHSSMPPPQTAIGVIAQAVHTLEEAPFPARMDHAGRFFAYVGPKMPFAKRLVFANLWLFEPLVIHLLSASKSMNASLRTTTAATMISGGVKDNVLPTRAEAVVNFRILPGDTPESVKARVERVLDDPRVEVTYAAEDGFGDPPSSVSDVTAEGFAKIRDAIRATAQDSGLVVAPYLVVGATDSRYFRKVAENTYRFLFVRLAKEDLERMHGHNERISIDNHAEAVRFYHSLLSSLD